ncbi:GGDEF domain-containing protein [Salinisphaera sp. PC39]|uniref:GGDEF domain-containing protein n=1 Tax=Salinisphaera sp. PC39 TaxID=1304156 RepID=UPI00333E3EBD
MNDVKALRAQRARGYRLLRFASPLESRFCEDYRESGRGFRLALLCLGLLTVLGTPLYNDLLNAPEGFQRLTVPVLYGLQVPAFVIAIAVTAVPAWRRYADIALVGSALLLAFGFLAERAIGAVYGFDIPLEFIGVLVVAVFFIARLRFRAFLPAALLMTAIMVANEALLVVPESDEWYRVMAMLLLVAVAFVGGYSQEYLARSVWLERGILEHLSMHDDLTGVLNRRAALETIDRGLRHAAREGARYGIAMIDLDHFKDYNDAYGHARGDDFLKHLADLLRGAARRPQDCVGRLGGEEFVLAWYDADPAEMVYRAESLRRELELGGSGGVEPWSATMSVGLVTLCPRPDTRPEPVIEAADGLLYRAKDAGRNRVIVEHW